ncbi:MAG: hypothetical protein KJ914_13105 [Gammaproteobacteria bacterium]|nr:hypothetical protein [Gammaproteobacteria bacterium]MBU1724868.1 hypothetical protein [Gammaproteobacteria bacterium]MBU2005052.1 hypothetical protein [Gammaproteobacteria bacterium]
MLLRLLQRVFGIEEPSPYDPEEPLVREAQSDHAYMSIELLDNTGQRQKAVLGYCEGRFNHVMIHLPDSGRSFDANGVDLVEAFFAVRGQLDQAGLIPLLAGSRRDCYPAGDARNCDFGDRFYVLHDGQPPDPDNMVYLFAEAPPEQVVSFRQQQAAFAQWKRSLD